MAEIYIPEGSRTSGPATPPSPRQSFWDKLRANAAARAGARPPMRWPFLGTARGLGKLPFRLGRGLTTGKTGTILGAMYPGPVFPWEREIAGTQQEFDPTQFGTLQGQAIPGVEETYSPIAGEYRPEYDPYRRAATYGGGAFPEMAETLGTEPGAYDAEFMSNLLKQQKAAQWEAEMESGEDASMADALRYGALRAERGFKDWLLGERIKKIDETEYPVYDISKKGTGEAKEKPLASTKTSVDGVQMTANTGSDIEDMLKMAGIYGQQGMGGPIDWKDFEKTYGMLLGAGSISGVGSGPANSLLDGVLGVARLQQDQQWRMINLMTQPKVTLYPVVPSEGGYELDSSRDIISQPRWKNIPAGFSPDRPQRPPTTASLTEVKKIQTIMRDEGVYAAWSHKVAKGDITAGMMGGTGSVDLLIGQYLAGIYTSLHPAMGNMIAIPNIKKLQEMIRDLNGQIPQEAMKAGTLERESWERWVATFGEWVPSPGMFQ